MSLSLARRLCMFVALSVAISLSETQPITVNVEIFGDNTIEEPPIALQIEDNSERSIALSPGKNYNITCAASHGFPGSESWYFEDGSQLTSVSQTVPVDKNVSAVFRYQPNSLDNGKQALRFQNFSSALNGVYKCVSNGKNKSLVISDSNPSIITSNHQLKVKDGADSSDHRLQSVFVSGVPRPDRTNITWRHNGHWINPDNNDLGVIIMEETNNLLFTSNFESKHEGTYSATVTTEAGTASDSFTIDIQVIPSVTLTTTPSQPVLGDTVQLICQDSQASKPSPNFTWSFNSSPISASHMYMYNITIEEISSNTSVLTIQSANFSHNGQYRCNGSNSAGFHTSTHSLQVMFPAPSVPTITLLSSSTPQYAGGRATFTCQSTLQVSPLYTGSVSANITWRRDGVLLSDTADRISISQTNGGLLYTSTLMITGMSTVMDSGNYTCHVNSIASTYTSSVQNSTGIVYDIPVPPINVHLTPGSLNISDFSPYNKVLFNCSAVIPNQHSIDLTFIWYRNSQRIIPGQGDAIIEQVSRNTSSLSYTATNAGTELFSCMVEFSLPTPDPNVTMSRNGTVRIKGPVSPLVPVNIAPANINYSSAIIQLTVQTITYSPETYFVRYGTSENNLNLISETVWGSSNLDTRDETYSIPLRYLSHNQIYYYTVVANNSHGQTTSAVKSFKTLKLDLLQFKAGPFRGCSNGRVLDAVAVKNFMKTQISTAVSLACSCFFPPTNLINGSLLCTAPNSNELIFRVYIVSSSAWPTSAAIISHVTEWVRSDPLVTSGVAQITFDTSCNVSISSLQEDVCTTPEVTATEPPTSGQVTDTFGSNADILIAVVAGAVILLEAVIIIILFCALCHQNSKIRMLVRKRSPGYANVVRRSSSIVDGPQPPSSKWRGDAYVTTECPAYLSAYKPKELEDMEHDPTPGIYDSIDHLNRRDISPHQHPIVEATVTQSTIMGTSDSDDNTGSSMMS